MPAPTLFKIATSMVCPILDTGSNGLPSLSEASIVRAIEVRSDPDFHNSWLALAYEAMGGVIQAGFLEEIELRLYALKGKIADPVLS
jgi:hypothetical protein